MSKVITFSRTFPAYHAKAGQPTYFVEKIWTSFRVTVYFKPNEPTYFYQDPDELLTLNKHFPYNLVSDLIKSIGNYSDKFEPKHHTIRMGNRWKVGDKFSPRVWSGKPYQSKQIVIAPDIEIKQIYTFSKDLIGKDFYLNGFRLQPNQLIDIAKNDGLELSDMLLWLKYPKPFSNAQIICWSDSIDYKK